MTDTAPVQWRDIWALSWPSSLSTLGVYFLGFSTIVITGHIGRRELGGLMLGTLTCNVTGNSVVLGLLSAMDTLCPQAIGAGNFERCGYIAQRALLLGCLLIVPIQYMWFNAEGILLACGQKPALAALAASYTRVLVWGLPAFLLWSTLRKFIETQGQVRPGFFVALVSVPVHMVLCVKLTGMYGFLGAPISVVVSYWGQFFMLLGYVLRFRTYEPGTWPGWSLSEATSGWMPYLLLAIPGLFMMSLEWWEWEILSLIAGQLGEVPMAAHGILATLCTLAYRLPMGTSRAASIIVGRLLGAGAPDAAQNAAILCMKICFWQALVAVAVMLTFQDAFIRLFTDDVDTAALVRRCLVALSAYIIVDHQQGIMQGIFAGCGKQVLGAGIIFVGAWLVALPVGWHLSFSSGVGLPGIYVAQFVGYFCVAVIFMAVMRFHLDWQSLARAAAARSTAAAPAKLSPIPTGTSSAPASAPDQLVIVDAGVPSAFADNTQLRV